MKLRGSRILLWSVPRISGWWEKGDFTVGAKTAHRFSRDVRHEAADPNDIIYTTKSLRRRMEDNVNSNREINRKNNLSDINEQQYEVIVKRVQEGYSSELLVQFLSQEDYALTLPSYLTRAHRALLIDSLGQGGTPVPSWLQEGLVNISCLSFAGNFRRQGLYPQLPPDLQHDHRLGSNSLPRHTLWQKQVYQATASTAPFSTHDIWSVPNEDRRSGQIKYGPPLSGLEATRQVQFFYKEFGRGAVVETLQRLGSGQSIDEALQGTTGLNQAQFFAAWQRWNAQPPAAPSRIAPATPTEAEPEIELGADQAPQN